MSYIPFAPTVIDDSEISSSKYSFLIKFNEIELLIARNELNEKPKKVQLEKIKDELKKEGQKIFYFDRDNSHKDMMALVEALEKEGFNIYFREIKFGLADDEYMYEVHAL